MNDVKNDSARFYAKNAKGLVHFLCRFWVPISLCPKQVQFRLKIAETRDENARRTRL